MEEFKTYVEVLAYFSKDGKMIPKSFTWKDGHVYEIQKITDTRRAISFKAGGVGIRYTFMIDGRTGYLYYDNYKWFIEKR